MNTLKDNRWIFDPIDKMIFEQGLRIKVVYFQIDLDLMVIVLNNGKVLRRKISEFQSLKKATEKQLNNYEISRTGVHWPGLDEDLSLRGFLKYELISAV